MSEGDRPDGPEPSPWWTPGGAPEASASAGPPDESPADPNTGFLSWDPPSPPPQISYGAPATEDPAGAPTWSYGSPWGAATGDTAPLPGSYGPTGSGHIGSPPRGPDYMPPAPYPSSPGYGPSQPAPPVAPPGRETRAARLLVIALVAALIGGVLGGIGGVAFEHNRVSKKTSDLSSGPPLATGSPTPVNHDPKSVASIAAKLLPSVVTLNVAGATERGTGSGVVIRSDGYILTNNHVVEVAANGGTITADFYKGRQGVAARIVGRDPKTDLAVVRVDLTNLPAATLGQSASLVVGDPVVALGAPLGLSSTVTSGIISALDRNVEVPDENGGSSGLLIGAIQTDAAINPGNSGGPLVDDQAQVIGINSAIASASSSSSTAGNIGVGFAIPIDYARSIADEIIRTGKATHPYVGVTAQPADASGANKGALIVSVVAGGPADKAGLKEGDVITKVDSKTIGDVDELVAATRLHKVG
ncbi:MAG: peptidase and chymotrypsin/Hap, partial [Mycobacterium sp.]|nr:peptidase and chymotrypsin/Hap [Mycobacterium sp.]